MIFISIQNSLVTFSTMVSRLKLIVIFTDVIIKNVMIIIFLNNSKRVFHYIPKSKRKDCRTKSQ